MINKNEHLTPYESNCPECFNKRLIPKGRINCIDCIRAKEKIETWETICLECGEITGNLLGGSRFCKKCLRKNLISSKQEFFNALSPGQKKLFKKYDSWYLAHDSYILPHKDNLAPESLNVIEGNVNIVQGVNIGKYSPEIQELILAAVDMPRETPAAGGAGTIHDFKIPASHVWDLDKALDKLGIKRISKEDSLKIK